MTSQTPDNTLCRLENDFIAQHAGALWPLASCFSFYLQAASKLRAQIRELVEQSTCSAIFAAEMDALVGAAADLDTRMDSWLARNEHWQPQSIPTTQSDDTIAPLLATHFFADPAVLLYRGRMTFMRLKLHESMIAGLRAKLAVLERELQSCSIGGQATSASFAAIDKDILTHVAVVQHEAAALLGWVACGLGDVDEEGVVVCGEVAMGCDDGHKHGMLTMEFYVHLANLQRCNFVTDAQLLAAGVVLNRIVNSFRTL